MYRHYYVLIACILGVNCEANAHQPVMDMAPRWADGYGIQLRYEQYGSGKLLRGNAKIANPLGLNRYVKKTWLEGVYTFDKSLRITAKIPYIRQSRITNINGVATSQNNNGIGDLIIGVPVKKYYNNDKSTANLSFTPSLRIPTGNTSGAFPISDGSWDMGLSLSYSKSTSKFYQLYDVFYWKNTKGKNGLHEGNELGLDVNLGYHPYHDNLTNTGIFVMWDITARHHGKPDAAILTTASGGDSLRTGPVLVGYRNSIMVRAEYKYPVYENKQTIGLSRGHEFTFGIGVTF